MGALAACGFADQFSGHSLEYNAQAETIKNQTLMVNIIRAAYRRPLQFTDLSSISAQLSVSGTAGFDLPFWGPRAGGQRLFDASPSITVANSPTYTVAVLNTKEFYQGILAPIPMKTLSYYLGIGFPKYLLLTLVVAEIEYGTAGATKRVYNAPHRTTIGAETKPAPLAFADLLKTLIAMGLTIEERPVKIGAPFGPKMYPQAKDVAELDAKGVSVVALGGARFQLEKTAGAPRFCFDPTLAAEGIQVRAGMPIGGSGEALPAGLLCGAEPDGRPADRVFAIRTHSTEGVIYYLGEIVRRQLGLVARSASDWDPEIFHLKEGGGGAGTITASYEGKDYHIDVDPSGVDRSSQVLDLVGELLAQNNSAKDLPAPSVIPIAR